MLIVLKVDSALINDIAKIKIRPASDLPAGLKSGQFDQKTDSSVVESDMRIYYWHYLS